MLWYNIIDQLMGYTVAGLVSWLLSLCHFVVPIYSRNYVWKKPAKKRTGLLASAGSVISPLTFWCDSTGKEMANCSECADGIYGSVHILSASYITG